MSTKFQVVPMKFKIWPFSAYLGQLRIFKLKMSNSYLPYGVGESDRSSHTKFQRENFKNDDVRAEKQMRMLQVPYPFQC